ncbi:MAG: 2-hydroxyacyl-CoA dehydratase family protein [Chloroflexota bacterium]
MTQASKGLTRVKEINQDRSRRVKELRNLGKKIIGYLCIYPPLEMMTALGLVPYRIFGDIQESVTEADKGLPVSFCPFVRSCFDLGMKGKYDFIDGMVAAHTCDAIEKTAHVWERSIKHPYFHFIDIPPSIHRESQDLFRNELDTLRKTLESFAGEKLTNQKLNKAIKLHNEQRALVRELYELKKSDPPLISGVDTLLVIKAIMSIPVREGNKLLREVITEVKKPANSSQKKAARLLVWGTVIDDKSLIEMIESAGADVVIDDTCVGTRAYWDDVKLTKDPLEGLAKHYLADLKCPRTFIEAVYGEARKDHMADLENRFGYLKNFIREWNVNGVILQSVKYCDCHGFEVPEVKFYLDSLNLPNTYIEHDYTEGALAPLKTRVQALLEIIA